MSLRQTSIKLQANQNAKLCNGQKLTTVAAQEMQLLTKTRRHDQESVLAAKLMLILETEKSEL